MNSQDWQKFSNKLKTMITDPILEIHRKYQDSINVENTVDMILLTNISDAIRMEKDDRRYLVLDISNERVGDEAYFAALKNYTNSDSWCESFYWSCVDYCNKVKKFEDFNDLRKIETEEKTYLISKSIHSFYKYIKAEYILSKLDLNKFLSDLVEGHNAKENYKIDNRVAAKLLREIGIVPRASTGNRARVTVSHADLLDIFTKKKWITQYDEFADDEEEPEEKCNAVEKAGPTDEYALKQAKKQIRKQDEQIKKQDDLIKKLQDEVALLRKLVKAEEPKKEEEKQETKKEKKRIIKKSSKSKPKAEMKIKLTSDEIVVGDVQDEFKKMNAKLSDLF